MVHPISEEVCSGIILTMSHPYRSAQVSIAPHLKTCGGRALVSSPVWSLDLQCQRHRGAR